MIRELFWACPLSILSLAIRNLLNCSKINFHNPRRFHLMDTERYKHGLSSTHADLFLMLADKMQEVYNEATSSEPDDNVIEKYSDDLWDTFHTLSEPFSLSFKTNHNGRTVRLKFLIEAYDEDGLPSPDDDNDVSKGEFE
jgi:hypothetical protein